jgi:hypothetical protein
MHTVVPSAEFTAALHGVKAIPRADEVIRGLIWAISNKPDDFPVLVDTERLHLAKSEKIPSKSGRLVQLYLWFATNPGGSVELLELEIVPIPSTPYVM